MSDDEQVFLSPAKAARLSELINQMGRYTEELADTSDPLTRHAIWKHYAEAEAELFRVLPPATGPR